MAYIPSEILPQILVLIQSPLLQGGALHAMLDFFQAIVGLPKLGFKDLLQVSELSAFVLYTLDLTQVVNLAFSELSLC